MISESYEVRNGLAQSHLKGTERVFLTSWIWINSLTKFIQTEKFILNESFLNDPSLLIRTRPMRLVHNKQCAFNYHCLLTASIAITNHVHDTADNGIRKSLTNGISDARESTTNRIGPRGHGVYGPLWLSRRVVNATRLLTIGFVSRHLVFA